MGHLWRGPSPISSNERLEGCVATPPTGTTDRLPDTIDVQKLTRDAGCAIIARLGAGLRSSTGRQPGRDPREGKGAAVTAHATRRHATRTYASGLAIGLIAAATLLVASPAAQAACSSATAYSQATTSTAGLVSYWRLGESSGTVACDSKGANAGAYTGGVTLAQPGALLNDPATSASFDGSTGYVGVPVSSSLNVGDTVTIEAWVKRASAGTAGNQVIASKQAGSWVLMFNHSDQLVLRQSQVGDIASSIVTVSDTSKWHYVAATKNGAAVHLYVDGTDVTGAVYNQTLSDNSQPLVIGQSAGGAFFGGDLEEVALYNQALSSSQVASHYKAGSGKSPAPLPTCTPQVSSYSKAVTGTGGIVSYWRLGEAPGALRACDAKGSNPGAYSGGATFGQPGAIVNDPATSVAFDGSSGYVNVPASSSLNVGDKLSIEAWVKRASAGTAGNQVIASKQAGSWVLMFNPSDQLVLRQSQVGDIAYSWQTLSDTSRWHHVVATKNGPSVHLYLDGDDVTGAVANSTLSDNTQPLVIGESAGGGFLGGNLQEVALYNNALSPSQVAQHYQAGTGSPPAPTGGGTGTTTGSVPSASSGDPVIAAAGDIACSPSDPDFNAGRGDASGCQEQATAALMSGGQLGGVALSAILPLGDDQYDVGALSDFMQSFGPTWGANRGLLHPVTGNHEYLTPAALGYFDYFNGPGVVGGASGNRGAGYYSFNVGSWHLVALNSNCGVLPDGCAAGSAQEQWLKNDLSAAKKTHCILAYWHHPIYTSGPEEAATVMAPMWGDLYNAHATLVLNGHDHQYERFAPQNQNGQADAAHGITEFIAGTGGRNLVGFTSLAANSLVRDASSYGVLQLTLHATSYSWQFVPTAGGTLSDSGSGACRN
jgi:hypothetical protein